MTFTFETLPIENKDALRQSIIDLFDRDIATVSCSFSSRNFVFIFSAGCFPAIIRIGIETPHRTAEDVLSELMWVDDLKNDIPNICQPIPSLSNRMVERVSLDDTVYIITMFRKANGSTLPDTKWDAKLFYDTGALLGKIHHSSFEGHERGFRYKRSHWDESPFYDFSCYEKLFSTEARADAEALKQRLQSIPRDPRWYGMIHGDYQNGNLFYDWGDLWVFDFDDCCYGYFMYDIASLAHVFMYSLHCDIPPRERLLGEDGILTQIRAGYSTEHQLPDEQWNLFDDFFRLFVTNMIGLHVVHELLPEEFLVTLYEPMLALLKTDVAPVDLIAGIIQELMGRLTPEEIEQVLGGVMG